MLRAFCFLGGEKPLRAYKTAAYWLTQQIILKPVVNATGFLLFRAEFLADCYCGLTIMLNSEIYHYC